MHTVQSTESSQLTTPRHRGQSREFNRIRECFPPWLTDSREQLAVLFNEQGFIEHSNAGMKELGIRREMRRPRKFNEWCSEPGNFSHLGINHLEEPVKMELLLKNTNKEDEQIWTAWEFKELFVRGKKMFLGMGRKSSGLKQRNGEQISNNIANAIHKSAILSVADRSGRIISVNDKFCEFTKYSREELIGKKHLEVVYEYHSRAFWQDMMSRIIRGLPWTNDVKVQSKDGQVYWFHTLISPVIGATGRLEQVIHIQYDITAHKIAEEQKLDLYNRYDKITANLPGFAFQYHARHNGAQYFPFATDGVVRLLGVSPHELNADARAFFSRVHPEDVDDLKDSMTISSGTMTHWNVSFRMFDSREDVIWVQYIATPEKLNDGSVIWHGFCYDITDQKNSEEQLMRQQRRLAEIAFIQSHEFRRPIANMLGIFDVMHMQSEIHNAVPPSLKELLNLLHTSVKETDAIIAKIVTKTEEEEEFARLEAEFL